jgi:hypothetical protein
MPRWARYLGTLVVAALLLQLGVALASAKGGHGCPLCGCAVCRPVETIVKEKKHCWEVECKTICIPAIRWPWTDCCQPPCGKAKTVKVLKKVEYECARCGYEWELQAVECQCSEK